MGQEPGCLIHLQLPVQPPAVDVITQPKHSCYFSAMKFYIAVGQTSGQQNGVIRHLQTQNISEGGSTSSLSIEGPMS